MRDMILASSLRIDYRDLYSNQITSIQSGGFLGLGKLATLSVASLLAIMLVSIRIIHRALNFNNLTSIESGAFLGLGNLTILSAKAMPIGMIVLAHVQV